MVVMNGGHKSCLTQKKVDTLIVLAKRESIKDT